MRRLIHILRQLAIHLAAGALAGRARAWPWLARRFPLAALPGPERLRRLFEDLGGTFLKFGQMLALQPDILSFDYCNALFNLLDRVAPFALAEVERVFREETGRRPGEMLERFEPEPLSTASIGQVHVAWLDGRKVAVKVQRPVVEVDFEGDIRLMTLAIAAIRRCRLKRFYWMLEPMGEFVAWTREELDYRNEARYMRQLRDNAAENADEHVPEVFFASRRVLIAEFLEGVTVLDYLRALEAGDELLPQRLKLAGFEPAQFARRMIDNFLGDAFRHGLFHADLHPANLMVLPGSVVGYVDFGITGVLSRYSRLHLVEMTLAYTRADLDAMGDAFLKVTTLDADADPEAFRAGLRRYAEGWYHRDRSGSRLRKNFTLVMLDMLRLSRATGIWPERDVIKYIRSAIAIDGLITRFAPGFDVGRYLAEVCSRHLGFERVQEAVSRELLIDWSASSARLARDGLLRAGAALDRFLGRGPAPAPASRAERASARDLLAGRAVAQGGALFGFAVLMSLAAPAAGPGLDVFTTAGVLAAAALVLLLDTLRRLAVGR